MFLEYYISGVSRNLKTDLDDDNKVQRALNDFEIDVLVPTIILSTFSRTFLEWVILFKIKLRGVVFDYKYIVVSS